MGLVTPLGLDVASNWDALMRGQSGIAPITLYDLSKWKTEVKIAGEVKGFDPLRLGFRERDLKRYDRFTLLSLDAAVQAITQAGLTDLSEEELDLVAVVAGSGVGGLETITEHQSLLGKHGAKRIGAFTVPRLMVNAAPNMISMRYGFTGPSFDISTACASGTDAIGHAWRLIRTGEADVAVACGVEAPITPLALEAFSNMTALSKRNVPPEQASCPFNRQRDGFVIAEGAGVLVLEEEVHARARGAEIFGFVAGYATTTDAFHLTSPRPDGKQAIRVMRLALRAAGIPLERVAYINAHGTSTPTNDKVETRVIREVFQHLTPRVPVSSTKSMTGHSLGACGAIEAIFSLTALLERVAPPTINRTDPDHECDLFLPGEPYKISTRSGTCAVSNTLAFGGTNSVLVLEAA
jgi:3-oxoacyl-[acyl-carrier-protein] synthase II